jgi:hypothetical protein
LKTHKKASYREIEMLRVALYLVAEKAAAIAARDITAAIIPSKALTKHTHTHTCILNYFMKMVVASITSVMAQCCS